MGTILMVAMAGSAASAFHVHPWIALAAGACFPIAGLMVLLMSRKTMDHGRVFGLLGVVLVTLMAITAWGVAFSGGAAGLERLAVGGGAAVASVVALYQGYRVVKRWRHSRGA